MDQADWAVVAKRSRIRALGQQGQQGLIETLKPAPAQREQLVEGCHEVTLNHSPALLKEFSREPVGSRRLALRQSLNRRS
jgi:hypothetical protein